MPWQQRSEVVGLTAGGDLKAGTILHPKAVFETQRPGTGEVSVGLSLKPNQLPAGGLQVGDHVKAVWAPSSSSSNANLKGPPPAVIPSDGVLVSDAFVLERGPARNDGTATVTIIVKSTEALALTQQNALGAVSLLELPRVGR